MIRGGLLRRTCILWFAAWALAGCASAPPPIKLASGGPGSFHIARVEVVPPEGASAPLLQSHMHSALATIPKPAAITGQPAVLRLVFSKFSKGRVGLLVGDVSMIDTGGRIVAESKGVSATHRVGGSADGAAASGGLLGALVVGAVSGIMQGVAERDTVYEQVLSVAFTDQLSTRLFKPNGIGIRDGVPIVLMNQGTANALQTATTAIHLGYYQDRKTADAFVQQFWVYRADVLRHFEPQVVAWMPPQGGEQHHIYAVPLGAREIKDGCEALKSGGAYCAIAPWRPTPQK